MYKILLFFVCIIAIECHQNHQDQVFQQQPPPPPPPVPSHQAQPNSDHHSNSMMDNINKDHVLEHLDGVINKPKDQMTIDEQNFYYFKLHDYDNNNMLDGLELVSAFAHNNEHDDHHPNNASEQKPQPPRISDDELIKLIDGIMKDEDKNLDGYITYQEFLHAIKG